MVQLTYYTLSALSFLLFIYVAYISLREKALRAVKMALISGTLLALVFLLCAFKSPAYPELFTGILLFLSLIFVALLVPFGGFQKFETAIPTRQIDERDTMFSRNELLPETEQYTNYYCKNPEKLKKDEKFRNKPGLLSPDSVYYEPKTFRAARVNGNILNRVKQNTYFPAVRIPQKQEKKDLTKFLKAWSLQLGAHSAGITTLKNTHFYSHKGRGNRYGETITNSHTHALAFTVEMNHQLVQSAPRGTMIMESTQQYLSSGIIALQVAEYLSEMGYEARAHIDGNYEVVCPLVARDAGLGEIGRMGLLMTPKLGPRVRIAVVTTNAPLQESKFRPDASVIDFCTLCKKCATACPSKSIPFNHRSHVEGSLRWQINSETCFTYWTTIGTDCGKCMQVCPYSHPNNALHNVIRWGIRNNWLFRRIALLFDDFFYGKHHGHQKFPSWIKQ